MNTESTKILSVEKIEINPRKVENKADYKNLAILPTRGLVLFPGATIPIVLKREASVRIAEYVDAHHECIGVFCQNNPDEEYPSTPDDLFEFGVVADIVKILSMPDGNKIAITKAREKIELLQLSPHPVVPNALSGEVKPIRERKPRTTDREMPAIAEWIRQHAKNLIEGADGFQPDIMNIDSIENPVDLINIASTVLPLPQDAKQFLISRPNPKERGFALLKELSRQELMMQINKEVGERTHQNITEQQKRAFLQQQLDTIKHELYGEDDPDEQLAKLKEKAAALPLPEEVRNIFNRECSKLSRLAPQSPDYAVLFSYLELLVDLPWGNLDPLNDDIEGASAVLEADHFGLEKVKQRILEQIALMIHAPSGKSPIICLVGPPGVGKTSLGQSIATALGRKYRRVALGGLHDESEIRGHRRTYIGAMPGRIIDALRRTGTKNPVLLLDEIDKISSSFHGDPSAALLEVLDPEQNVRFHDNYVDVDFDLSQVLFIATANSLAGVASPLVDRMEIIDISGYLLEEKVEIAKRHLIPKLLAEASLSSDELTFGDDCIVGIIESYTSESGVRQLEKRLASVIRKIVLRKLTGKPWNNPLAQSDLFDLLGAAPFIKEKYEDTDYPGVVIGLAWTSAGGCVLTVEASIAQGKGEKLNLTGNLGDVMKESAAIALQHVKTNADSLDIDKNKFDDCTLHIHVPEGAIPKDGPSAGITMATAIASIFTGRKARPRTAMTGELTLRGKVLPIGGVKEKILAAKRAGVTDVILPRLNKKDVDEIQPKYIDGLTIHYVDDIKEVLELALL